MIDRTKLRRWRTGKTKRPQTTPEEKQEIIEMYREGYNVPAIAKKYKRTTTGIYKLLKVNNIR